SLSRWVCWVRRVQPTLRGPPASAKGGYLNPNVQIVQFDLTGRDQHLSGAITHCTHRLHGVENEVKDDLLELDPITGNDRQAFRELGLHRGPVLECFSSGKLNHLLQSLVHVYPI